MNYKLLSAVLFAKHLIGYQEPKVAISIQKPAQARSIDGFADWYESLLMNRIVDRMDNTEILPLLECLKPSWGSNKFRNE